MFFRPPPAALTASGAKLGQRVIITAGGRSATFRVGGILPLGDGAQHGPGVRRVALALQPRRVVVAADEEVETLLLGGPGVPDQLARTGLLGHQRVPESRHASTVGSRPPAPPPPKG